MMVIHFFGTFFLEGLFLFSVWFVVGAVVSISLSFARLGHELAPPEVPQRASESSNVSVH